MTTTFQPELAFDPNVPDSELAEALHTHCQTTIRQVAALNALTEKIESAGLYEQAAPMRFNGPCFDQKHDGTRLTGQIVRVFDLMRDGKWRTLAEIEKAIGDPQSSISAQLRHLRKPRFGGHTVEKRSRGNRSNGLWEYRVSPTP